LRLVSLLEEKARREREKKANYTPNDGQRPVHTSDKMIRAVFSGNGAGKTCMGANEVLWAVQGYNPIKNKFTPVPCRGIILLDNPNKIADVWLGELGKWTNLTEDQLHKRGRPYVSEITFPNGSQILFMTHDQNPLMFESVEADFIVCDEPCPHAVYKALLRGLRKLGSEPWVLMLGTPITAAWMRTEIFTPWSRGEAPHIECFRFSSDVNKVNLNWDFYESVFFKGLSEEEIQIRRHGSFFDLSGLALAHLFNRSTHVVKSFEWPKDWSVVIAVDPHPSKENVACMLGVDRDGYLYYIKELSSDLPPRAFARQLKEWFKGYRIHDIIVDSLGSTPTSGGDGNKSFIEVMNEEGIRARATTFKEKNDEDFISRLSLVLELPVLPNKWNQLIPKLRVFEGNTGIIGDIENVCWVKYRNVDEYKPKLDISHKDFLACLKYALTANISSIYAKSRILRRPESSWTGSPGGKLPLYGSKSKRN
jgi:hypothetical protein